jgi:hypothetical protein
MSNVVEFPPSDRPITESDIDKLHSEAFRDLEPSICDCESMAKIAAQIAMNTKTEDRELVFAVVHAMEMLTAQKKNYYAAWDGERSKLTPKHVLVDLFGSGDFPAEIIDPERAAEIRYPAADRCRI